MRHDEPEIIRLLYRDRNIPLIYVAVVLSLTAYAAGRILTPLIAIPATVSATFLIATIIVQIQYRLHPYCPVCGLDAVDCKINRKSGSGHVKPKSRPAAIKHGKQNRKPIPGTKHQQRHDRVTARRRPNLLAKDV